MQVDDDPLQIKDTHYTEPLEWLVVEATEGPNVTMDVVSKSEYSEKIKVIHSHAEEELIYFLNNVSWKILKWCCAQGAI